VPHLGFRLSGTSAVTRDIAQDAAGCGIKAIVLWARVSHFP